MLLTFRRRILWCLASVVLIMMLINFTYHKMFIITVYNHHPHRKSTMDTRDEIELTIRMPGNNKMVKRVMCDFLRSAVLFWDKRFGNIHFILDEKDKVSNYFPRNLPNLNLPFKMRFTYEKQPNDVTAMTTTSKSIGKPYGYLLQLYSSFLMDQ